MQRVIFSFAILFVAATSLAAEPVYRQGLLTGINGLQFAGQSYNVTFEGGSYDTVYAGTTPLFATLPSPTNFETAELATLAIRDALVGSAYEFATTSIAGCENGDGSFCGIQTPVFEFNNMVSLWRLIVQPAASPVPFSTGGYPATVADAEITWTRWEVVVDSDGDGVPEDVDNCQTVANAGQDDGDSDGYGNACDGDLNNDCITNPVDLGIFASVFFTGDPAADLNSDGIVNPIDLGIMRTLFFEPPGPSGVASCGP